MERSAKHIALLKKVAEKPLALYGGVSESWEELERVGLVKLSVINLSEVLIEITDAGRQALSAAKDPE